MVSLAYFDSYRSPWLPDNLIAVKRDYFGVHGYGHPSRCSLARSTRNGRGSRRP